MLQLQQRESTRPSLFMKMDSGPGHAQLPYWQVNIAPEDRQDDCPVALQNLSDKDIGIIGSRDEDYCVQSWDEVVDIVRTNRLQDFRRWPSELRRYREFIWRLKHEWGSVMEYMLSERLHWRMPLTPRGSRPFEYEEDFQILFNDWPYGVDERIVHLVVWTKFELRDDAETVAEIERFIERTFSPGVAKDKLLWFINPPSLKSIHTIEHIHVMLFDPDQEFIKRLTKGDTPRGRLLDQSRR